MSRSNVFFLLVAIFAIAAALWYRGQIPRKVARGGGNSQASFRYRRIRAVLANNCGRRSGSGRKV